MASSSVFEWTCEALERSTTLERLEARGTLRLALKAAGLDPRDVTTGQMTTVLQRVMPAELESRGVANGGALCEKIARELAAAGLQDQASADSPEKVFARLGGR